MADPMDQKNAASHEPARWFIRFSRGGRFGFRCFDENGISYCPATFTSKAERDTAATEYVRAFLAKLQTRFRGEQGILFGKPLSELVTLYCQAFCARDITQQHKKFWPKMVQRMIDLGGIRSLDDVKKSSIEIGLGKLLTLHLSAKTRLDYLKAIKGFAEFLYEEGAISRERLESIQRIKGSRVSGDRRNLGRPFTEPEFALLYNAALAGPAFMSIDGADCAFTFWLAYATGFRAKELRSLRVSNFCLTPGSAGVTIDGSETKNSKPYCVPLSDEAASFVAGKLAGKLPAVLAMKVPARFYESKCVKFYLKRTDIEDHKTETHNGQDVRTQNLTFHSLRRSFVTRFARNAKVPPKVTQLLSRHSNINLTMNVYAGLEASEERLAVNNTEMFIPPGGGSITRPA